ncbi:MAG: AMP-binding protein, partial [Rubrivivax sp.]|nr:AMP-binding protein [Rubrivivax sp.]
MSKHFFNLGSNFMEVAATWRDRPALRYPDNQYSYADLTQWVEGLAVFLLSAGIRSGDVIAIGNNKHPLSYALMLAALRLGIPYVNIDLASPQARNARILETSGASHLFYDDPGYAQEMQALASDSACKLEALTFDVMPVVSQADRETQQRLMNKVDGATIAYVMFTSGSTGTPKGVAVTHENVLHFITWGQQYFGIGEQDNFANLSPMYFDN